ncbi:hypothetical protein RJJ65_26520 [Rhizobium hidalgonense]|nr:MULTISPECIES: hypothetical protein [Rhizobium]MBX4863830.1 hypothetical protein [Rhizobium bangladeshense]MBY3246002.1 hypothetical protein [Rhizobium laguerreae]MDR9785295.1 hypothetical protein [Rhizobium redzepovicii]RUL97085.1 hypothetical protein EEQ99_28810 [Rhizobium anhuiense]MBA1344158.1 hypothetical protein [Rhizobium sp. WYCCWR 11146]
MWKAKEKQLSVEQINGHVAKRNRLIVGRAPENTEMLFTAAELYGAMAQCSSRAKMDQHAARAQVQMCRHLIARHVDDKNDRFALLDTARTLKDYVGKAMTGLVGDGIAYLQMVRDGYRWVDHFENHAVHGKPPTTRSPDYVFSRTGDLFVALAESKATKGASRAAFTKTVRDGYHGQVEPYLGRKIGTWIASHGYAVGSWMKSVKKAEIFIDHTVSSGSSSGNGEDPSENSDPRSVRFGSYCGVLTLLFGPDIGEAARDRRWRPSEQTFTTVDWLDRTWIVGEDAEWETLVVTGEEHLIFKSGALRFVNGMALDMEVARRVFALIESSEGDLDLMGELPEFPADLIEAAKRSGGAIFPDGFAVLGREEDLSHFSRISVKPPAQAAPALVEIELPADALVAEGIRLMEARLPSSSNADVVEENQARLFLTHE